ncbi:MAG: YihY/virulence factor BrkB family protein, partial [Lachnospiraceae bacterium]
VLQLVQKMLPSYVSPLLVSVISEVFTKSVGIVSVAAVAAIWSSAKGFQYLSTGLNVIYDLKETRNFLVLRIRAIGYTLLLLVAIVFTLVLLVFGNRIQKKISLDLPILGQIMNGMINLRMVIMLIGLVIFFLVLLKALPNRRASMLSQIPGAVLAALGWYGLSAAMSIYVDYFNGFSMYGSLTTVVLLMLWVYFCMYILLICAEINSLIGEWFAYKIRNRKKFTR